MQVARYWRLKQHLYQLTAYAKPANTPLSAEVPVMNTPVNPQPARSAEPMPAVLATVA